MIVPYIFDGIDTSVTELKFENESFSHKDTVMEFNGSYGIFRKINFQFELEAIKLSIHKIYGDAK